MRLPAAAWRSGETSRRTRASPRRSRGLARRALEARGRGTDVIAGAPVPLGGVRAGQDVRVAGRVGDPPADVGAHLRRKGGYGSLGGRPLGAGAVDARQGAWVGAELLRSP